MLINVYFYSPADHNSALAFSSPFNWVALLFCPISAVGVLVFPRTCYYLPPEKVQFQRIDYRITMIHGHCPPSSTSAQQYNPQIKCDKTFTAPP